ncbi:Uma2 family endonuclease [Micromonospora zhanjiangensis]|uniref:Uma2 family endonuclease n=1 Tax=Micromonospora zhanjiangensis TaxID=1522057 RepID=A0ABV8KFL0_9ACTN
MIIDYYPPEGGWTTDDLEDLPDDGHRRELLDGVLLLPLPRNTWHQTFIARLMVALGESCPPGLDATQGVEVRISRHRSFTPDGLVTTAEANHRNPSFYSPNEVRLVVEVVSAGSESIDRILKPALYAEAGIPYFWRIEINDGVVVHVGKLDPVRGTYVEQARLTNGIRLSEPWEIDIPLDRLTRRNHGLT